jgi:hypothetical protein
MRPITSDFQRFNNSTFRLSRRSAGEGGTSPWHAKASRLAVSLRHSFSVGGSLKTKKEALGEGWLVTAAGGDNLNLLPDHKFSPDSTLYRFNESLAAKASRLAVALRKGQLATSTRGVSPR